MELEKKLGVHLDVEELEGGDAKKAEGQEIGYDYDIGKKSVVFYVEETNIGKEADIYSFGIITQEVILLDMPYCDNHPTLEAEEIISKVKAGETPPYRPLINHDGKTSLCSLQQTPKHWSKAEMGSSGRHAFQEI